MSLIYQIVYINCWLVYCWWINDKLSVLYFHYYNPHYYVNDVKVLVNDVNSNGLQLNSVQIGGISWFQRIIKNTNNTYNVGISYILQEQYYSKKNIHIFAKSTIFCYNIGWYGNKIHKPFMAYKWKYLRICTNCHSQGYSHPLFYRR